MQKKLEDFTLEQLKSLVYDNLRQLQFLQNQNQLIEQEIVKREKELAGQQAIQVKEKEEN
jgi:hypothetical protein